jgi:hypothetical protein
MGGMKDFKAALVVSKCIGVKGCAVLWVLNSLLRLATRREEVLIGTTNPVRFVGA